MSNTANLICALRGPVMLITLGVLLASHRVMDSSFWKLWPVLIIVLGVMKLLEMMARRSDAGPLVPPGGFTDGGAL